MKTYSSSEIDLISHSSNVAADEKPQAIRQPDAQSVTVPIQRRPEQYGGMLGNIAAAIALTIAFCTLVLLSLRSTPPPAVAQAFELQPRPIWISTVPYGPRDGLVPDFGQANSGRPGFIQPMQPVR
jgi:hypothetical protein